jgi:hypothetical protein
VWHGEQGRRRRPAARGTLSCSEWAPEEATAHLGLLLGIGEEPTKNSRGLDGSGVSLPCLRGHLCIGPGCLPTGSGPLRSQLPCFAASASKFS